MKDKFKISLLDNGIHSFNKALEKFTSYEQGNKKDLFLLKEAIMFLHHGVELLLKQVLIDHGGEYLVFADIKSITKKKIKAKEQGVSVFSLDKPANTATYFDVIQRVKAFVTAVGLGDNLEKYLLELNGIRNTIEHYGVDMEKNKVERLLLKIRAPISKFFLDAGINLGQENKEKWKQLEKELLKQASHLRGGGMIRKAEFNNDTAVIEYASNFNEYKELQPQSTVTKEQWARYWSTGDAVLKALNDGSVRLMREIDELNRVIITIPFEENIYTIDTLRADLENFLGADFSLIKKAWNNVFSDPYVYNKEGR